MSRGGTPHAEQPQAAAALLQVVPPADGRGTRPPAGRTALRLDPDDLCRLAARRCAQDTPAEVEERRPRPRFRARAAPTRAG
ncbi:hypothetical protein [Streptomyces sp. NPDC017202]|uniref:hypothetical protein n=1 Tax=Streptomyces sp. NPDC017202 TaxID=3364981 RepID=UPI0037BD1082